MPVAIETRRFRLRELTLDDVSERYLKWFTDPDSTRYIAAASATRGLDDLRAFVAARLSRAEVLFLGIFEKAAGLHIGNIKYEPVDTAQGYAVMGIMVGDPAYRGRGVSGEVIAASAAWLREHRAIGEIVLGVSADNVAARRAYEKIGFEEAATPHVNPGDGALSMVWRL